MDRSSFDASDRQAARFCWSCKTGYMESAEWCTDCGRKLISRDEAETRMAAEDSEDGMIVLRTFSGSGEPIWVQSALEAAGIPCRLDQTVQQMGFLNQVQPARIFVAAKDREAALAILESREASADVVRDERQTDEITTERDEFWQTRRIRYLRWIFLIRLVVACLIFFISLMPENLVLAMFWMGMWIWSRTQPARAFAVSAILGTVWLVFSVVNSLTGETAETLLNVVAKEQRIVDRQDKLPNRVNVR